MIESTTIGAGYASLSMLDTGSDDADAIVEELESAMEGVITAEISHCVRNAVIDDVEMHTGEYIGFVGKELMAVSGERLETVCKTVDAVGLSERDICIIICGKDTTEAEADGIEKYIHSHYSGKEVYIIDGGQDVYDYIMIVE